MSQETATSPSQVSATDEADDWLIVCQCSSGKAILTLLSCLDHQEVSGGGGGAKAASTDSTAATQTHSRRARNQRGPQIVTVFCNPNCLTFHVQGASKQFQASVDIQSSWFVDYQLSAALPENREELDAQSGGEFCVNLMSVLECLHVLGTSIDRTMLLFSYNATQEYLKMELLLQDFGILSTSTVPGMVPPEDGNGADDDDDNTLSGHGLHIAFRSSPTVARMIVRSETLRQVVPEIESVTGGAVGAIALSSQRGLEIAVTGHLGECVCTIPSSGDHVVMLDIQKDVAEPVSNYPLHSLMASFRGLEMAQETCITMNANGMMAIQHQVLLESAKTEEGEATPIYVEFILCCLQDEDGDDDDGRTEGQRSRGLIMSQRSVEHSYQSSSSAVQATRSIAASSRATTEASRKREPPSPLSNGGEGDDNDDDDGEGSPPPPASTNPLFQSLVDSSVSKSPLEDIGQSRRQRRRYGRRSGQGDLYESRSRDDNEECSDADDDSSGAVSRGLLDSDEDDGNRRRDEEASRRHHEESQAEFSQPLDVTAPASSRTGDDDDESDPEIVYGPQH
mmetsp:Transcript_13031/g.36078  ORF Transcript_13031/g.36078 Transcript_13031/m.36078 type:complete len:566 (-) Transcript_13031:1729-3426(-)|eukprot:CAMPEP_0168734380 /NCGR_PEP_ID=MMETSP0724-20121128/8784_1 /TAXON_ID=265536 /ORGANISM="Amphiprora sp., Strain CCMP467" /LENGTH=565 /DNA_ID=CAMNT_0008781483 /DNA_START=1 /DNA_END=1698 /DNA_ORIENTATION=+